MTSGDHQNDTNMSPSSSESHEKPGRVVGRPKILSRLVSQEELPAMTEVCKCSPQYVSGGEDDEGAVLARTLQEVKRAGPLMRCVSAFDEAACASKDLCDNEVTDEVSPNAPPLPNPLHNANLRSTHVRALRLEAELQPMRMILGRLMAHPSNKKGIFNAPVNATALGLLDYHQIIVKPMDLGTIKSRLYSIAYHSRQEVAEDVWLCFENAMTYNPPKNAVHIAARTLRDFFEELYVAVGGEKKVIPDEVPKALDGTERARCAVAPPSVSRRVSFAEQPGNNNERSWPDGLPCNDILRTVSSEADLLTGSQPGTPSAKAADSSQVESIAAGPFFDAAPATMCTTPTGGSTRNEHPQEHGSPQSTRARTTWTSSMPQVEAKPLRRRRLSLAGSKKSSGHSCQSCLGRSCALCDQGCLPLEPSLLICSGGNCAGAKIRKGSTYYVSKDGSLHYCLRCFASLPPVLSQTGTENDDVRYKRELLKRKNDEELVEEWLTCSKCEVGVHQICAMHNSFVHSSSSYVCPGCVAPSGSFGKADDCTVEQGHRNPNEVYTFVTGSELPVPLSNVADSSFRLGEDVLSADALAETDMSAFIETKVKEQMKKSCNIPNVEKTITVRIISDCDRSFQVPEVVRKHFRMPTCGVEDEDHVVSPPKVVTYRSKAIGLFQRVDGLDVCIFLMYVQEYEGNDEYDDDLAAKSVAPKSKKRVYIAYLDSVEHFRPRASRTSVYHELLVSYLASARVRGFESAHIWACPPSRGNSFVFWNHPSSQRTPTKERLISWYHGALSKAIDYGVVTDVKSLYESDFHDNLQERKKGNEVDITSLHPSGKMLCPPLFEGDYWIEEAVRIHAASLLRHLKTKSDGNCSTDSLSSGLLEYAWDPCPARQIGALLSDRLMAHPSSAPFRRPVNAAALKLKDYHKIVTKPMDLGTVYSRCIHGEYSCLRELVSDVELVFSNAKRFNPPGNFVHDLAIEMESMFFKELCNVTKSWGGDRKVDDADRFKEFSDMSMSLDMRIEIHEVVASVTDYDSSSTDGQQATEMMSHAVSEVAEPALAQSPAHKPAAMMDYEISRPVSSYPTPAGDSHSEVGNALSPEELLLTGGPDAVSQRMVGEDTWLMDKKSPCPPKRPFLSKKGKGSGKRRRCTMGTSSSTSSSDDEPSSKRRRQTWLGEEVGASVRTMRTSFFSCSLVPVVSMSQKEQEKATAFEMYTGSYQFDDDNTFTISSSIAYARHALLEFSQYRNLEFATLRHAKYSTAMLLYHLHNHDAPGIVPICTTCQQETIDCRWHRIGKVEEIRKSPSNKKRPGRPAAVVDKAKYKAEELCNACHAIHPLKDQFIPLSVSSQNTR